MYFFVYQIIKASGISNIRVRVVYKAKHEVCTQVVTFSVVARPGKVGFGQNDATSFSGSFLLWSKHPGQSWSRDP
jgi:hypothetical protein